VRLVTGPGARIRRRASTQASAAQQSTDDKIKALEERVIALEGQLRILQSKQQPVEPVTNAAAAAPTTQAAAAEQSQTAVANTQQPVYGGATGQAKALNPDISLIGDFLGAVGHNTVRPVPTLEMHEAELGLQAIIDPTPAPMFSSPSANRESILKRAISPSPRCPEGSLRVQARCAPPS